MRLEHWPELLDAYVASVARTPFAWGSHDCCTLAADWVLACTGVDPMEPLRGTYRTSTGAQRILFANGGIEAMAGAALGGVIATAFAQRGDVVLAARSLGQTLGVCIGVDAIFPGIDGAERLLIMRCTRAWRVS